jgi:hypothetical protein
MTFDPALIQQAKVVFDAELGYELRGSRINT